MKLHKYIVLGLLIGLTFSSCEKDEEPNITSTEIRDEAEVAAEDAKEILSFLETHAYELRENLSGTEQTIEFVKISHDSVESLIESEFLKTKTVVQHGIDYTLYYLQLREGAPSKHKPTFADIVVLSYAGMFMDLKKFDASNSPAKFNLGGPTGEGGVIKGLTAAITEFRGATSYSTNPDNTVEFSDDFGFGAVFIPSGLAYFAAINSPAIPPYSPLIFTFQLYETVQQDHDGDEIPSFYEDLNGDKNLLDDDSDDDDLPNFSDSDDDNDGTLTSDEIEVTDPNLDGYISEDEINYIDSNADGTPDYLDPEVN